MLKLLTGIMIGIIIGLLLAEVGWPKVEEFIRQICVLFRSLW
jgi:hypothetical protein